MLLLLGAGLAMTVPINPPRYIPLEEKTIYGDPYKPKDHDPYKPKDHDYKHVRLGVFKYVIINRKIQYIALELGY